MATDVPTVAGDAPNVVLITCHDLGQHLGCYGVDAVRTPHLDRLADDGVCFENAYTTTPVCSPARGSLLTGRYPQSNGLMGLTHAPFWWRLHPGEQTLPELLGAAGYETHLAGMQHVTPDEGRLGFDHRHSRDAEADATSAAAADIFASIDEGPIYAQFGFSEVHRSFDQGTDTRNGVYVPPYLEATAEMESDLAAFQASINYLDEQVGTVLESLEATGHRDDTIVVFAADHGIPYPGAKWWCRSPGVEISLLMDGPGPAFEREGSEAAVISNVDVLPTLCDAIDYPVPEHVQGMSFHQYLHDESTDPPRPAAFTQYQGSDSRGIVTREHNLIRNFGAGRTVEYPVAAPPTSRGPDLGPGADPRPYAQLYDRQADPCELTDIAEGNPEIVADLSGRLRGWMAEIGDPLLRGPIATPYYDRAITDFVSE